MAEGLTIDEIDLEFVPSPLPTELEMEIGSELVLMGGWDVRTHALNPTAALIWRCLDGQSTLAEVADDLSSATGAPPDTVRGEVVAVARRFAELGLLAGFEPKVPENGGPQPTGPVPVEVGTALEDLTLPDLDGAPTSLSGLAARRGRLLLVNWSPGCSFCLAIGPDLAKLQSPLARQGVTLAFITAGTPDDNRCVLAAAGVDAPMLLKQNGIDPFPGFGTPAGYLLDGDGTVLLPVAHGAIEVPALGRAVVEAEAEPEAVGRDGPDDGPRATQYLPGPLAVCGPGSSSGGGTATDWTGTSAFAFSQSLGDVRYAVHVGVRHNEAAEPVLRRLFAGSALEDTRVVDNYSVVLHPPKTGGRRELNLLLRGGEQLVRSRSSARVLRGLLGYLSADIALSDPDLLYLATTPAVRDGQGILLPPRLSAPLTSLQPRLSRLGIRLVDLPRTTVDPATAELVVPEPALPHDMSVLEEQDARDGPAGAPGLGSELPAVLPGRYPLQTWYMAISPSLLGPVRDAAALASGLPLLRRGDDADGRARALLGVLERIERQGIWYEGPEELVGQLS